MIKMRNLYGVIDIGSNSVRLMVTDGVDVFDKMSVTTRLAEGIKDGALCVNSIERTAEAVAFLKGTAKVRGVKEVYAFATAAVRNSNNGDEFCKKVKELCGVEIDVISGETEAKIGYVGALNGLDGGLIDVGGASSEITVVEGGKPIYVKSLDLGAVKIKDACGQDRGSAEKLIENKLKEYGNVPVATFYAVGGTATTVAAILQSLEVYEPKKVQGYFVKTFELKKLADKLYSMSVEQRKTLKGLQPQRAEIIAGGVLLLLKILEMIGANGYYASEKDNLEGYFTEKVMKSEKKN
ncbi:MAG: hypothetical protein SPL13_05340 [Clostridia bacterium]|nr:hypothetical protein [Clostridia bacterium]